MKNLKKIALATSLLIAISTISAAQSIIWTLEQCIDTAWVRNNSVKMQENLLSVKRVELSQSKSNLLPNLNASIGQNFNFGRSISVDNTYQNQNSQTSSFGLSSSLMLFDGLKMKRNIDARKLELLTAGKSIEKMKKEIEINVSSMFLQVLLNKELLKNAENQIAISIENLKRRKELVAIGKLAAGELYETEAQLSKEELTLVRAKNDLQLSLLQLQQVMNIEISDDFDISIPTALLKNENLLLSAENVYAEALITRPEMQIAKYELENSNNRILIAKSGYMPTLSLGASWGTGYYNMSQVPNNLPFNTQFRNNMSYGIGLNLSIPIFNRMSVSSQIKTAKLDYKNKNLEFENIKLNLKKEIQQAYHNSIAAKERWKSAEKAVKASEESYRFANEKYVAGKGNLYEVNLAKTNLAQAISEHTQSKFEYAFRVKILELMK